MKKGPFKMRGYTYPGTSPVKYEDNQNDSSEEEEDD